MDCIHEKQNRSACTCTYVPCPRKDNCCACISYHRANNELPGCLFSTEAERTFDRSVENFISDKKQD